MTGAPALLGQGHQLVGVARGFLGVAPRQGDLSQRLAHERDGVDLWHLKQAPRSVLGTVQVARHQLRDRECHLGAGNSHQRPRLLCCVQGDSARRHGLFGASCQRQCVDGEPLEDEMRHRRVVAFERQSEAGMIERALGRADHQLGPRGRQLRPGTKPGMLGRAGTVRNSS